MILLHQGGQTTGGYNDKSCPNLTGDILPILAKLDPAIDARRLRSHPSILYLRAAARPGRTRCC